MTRAVLYARVSTEEQQIKGYSIRQQVERLREHAAEKGYEVVAEEVDPGHSGADLLRPGIDNILDRVEAGGVDVVLAQDADRITRDPGDRAYLDKTLGEHGARLVALDDWGDDTHQGQLLRYIQGWKSDGERRDIARRTRRGIVRKVKEGNIIPSRRINYGFRLDPDTGGYVVDEKTMPNVRTIFQMVGDEGRSIYAVVKALNTEGILTPTAYAGEKGAAAYWSHAAVRNIIFEDVYKPHTWDEVAALVRPDVAAALDRGGRYGVWYFNRNKVNRKKVREVGPDGERSYKIKTKATLRGREEWLAVPVPDAGIPRGQVDAARDRISKNVRPSKAGGRFWELSGGVLRCGLCGRSMVSRRSRNRPGGPWRYHYICNKGRADGTCDNGRYYRAEDVEGTIAGHVSDLLSDPDRIRADMDAAIARERAALRNADESAGFWSDRLAEIATQRDAYNRRYAKGKLSEADLDRYIEELDTEQATAEDRLRAVHGGQRRIEELEARKRAVLEMFGKGLLQGLEFLPPKVRRFVYDVMGLRVHVNPDWTFVLEGNVNADVIRHTRELEEYAERMAGWGDLPDFDTLAQLHNRTGGDGGDVIEFDTPVIRDAGSIGETTGPRS